MLYLKQSTAVTVKIGPFLDDADAVTPENGLTIEDSDVRLSKNGGDFGDKHEVTDATIDENGWYDCALDTTDTDTLGRLQLAVYAAGALPVFHEFMVVTVNVYDTLCSADNFDVEVVTKTGFALSAAGVDAVFDEALSGHAVADSLGLAMDNLLKLGKNKLDIDGTTLTIYDDDGTSVLYQWTLNSAVNASARTPV